MRVALFCFALPLFLPSPAQSWSANTGGTDAPTPRMIEALRLWQRNLPAQIPLLVVPDAELRTFHIDQFPAAIAIREGTVVSNSVLPADGAVRMTLQSLRASYPKH
jgi:hypothetical protein